MTVHRGHGAHQQLLEDAVLRTLSAGLGRPDCTLQAGVTQQVLSQRVDLLQVQIEEQHAEIAAEATLALDLNACLARLRGAVPHEGGQAAPGSFTGQAGRPQDIAAWLAAQGIPLPEAPGGAWEPEQFGAVIGALKDRLEALAADSQRDIARLRRLLERQQEALDRLAELERGAGD